MAPSVKHSHIGGKGKDAMNRAKSGISSLGTVRKFLKVGT
jgi:hypothetical protein